MLGCAWVIEKVWTRQYLCWQGNHEIGADLLYSICHSTIFFQATIYFELFIWNGNIKWFFFFEVQLPIRHIYLNLESLWALLSHLSDWSWGLLNVLWFQGHSYQGWVQGLKVFGVDEKLCYFQLNKYNSQWTRESVIKTNSESLKCSYSFILT